MAVPVDESRIRARRLKIESRTNPILIADEEFLQKEGTPGDVLRFGAGSMAGISSRSVSRHEGSSPTMVASRTRAADSASSSRLASVRASSTSPAFR